MKTLLHTFICLNFLLIITGNSLSAQSGSASHSSSSLKTKGDSVLSRIKASHSNSNSNANSNSYNTSDSDDGITGTKGELQQNGAKLSRNIDLKGETDIQEIIFNVSEKDSILEIIIYSLIMEGQLHIEIYNPSGEKTGNCSLTCTNSKDKRYERNDVTKIESTSCSLSKSFSPPLPGDWKIDIRYIKAKGGLKIDVN